VIARLRVLTERLEGSRARLLIRVLFITTAITFTLLPFVRFLHSGTQMDYRTWFDAGQTVLHGSEIYPHTENFPFMYPPTCALLLAAPAFFGKPALILILSALNTMVWILCIRFSSTLISEQRAQNAPIVIANFIVIPFVWSSYHLGQPSLILLALMLGAFLSLRHGHEIIAGALVALAVAIKAFPLLAIFYLVYRRYWTAAISLVIALVILLFLLPIPFRGWHQTLNDARDWQRGMLHYEQGGIAQRPERGYTWKNQSIFGLANRLLRRVSVDEAPSPPAYANVADLDFRTVNIVIIASALLLGFSFVAAMPRQRAPGGDAREFAALLSLILIFTPLTFGYLFVWLMFPLALLIKRSLEAPASLIWLLIALALLTATGIAPRLAQIYGSLFFAAFMLYLALAIDLRREQNLIAK
jgi:glycosyl transferase family 87